MVGENRSVNQEPQVIRELKSDVFGRIELLEGPRGALVRRVACGSRIPGSGLLARYLMARERRALACVVGLKNVSQWLDPVEFSDYLATPSLDGSAPRPSQVLLRHWIPGGSLQRASELPLDFFERLEDLVYALHQRGVCHNDLHKEPNVLVDSEGFPALIDFQLSSVHKRRGSSFSTRTREDLRHVEKHRRRYQRAGAGRDLGADLSRQRSLVAKLWMRLGKPIYNLITRRVLRYQDGEERRAPSGPWPRWTPALGPAAVPSTKLPKSAKPRSESTDSG